MTFLVKKFAHSHRWFIEAGTGDMYCACGVKKGAEEKRKYHNKSSIYNEISYHSKLEADYAAQLDMRIRAKDIVRWERQVKLDLKVNGVHIANYYIDFIIHYPDGHREFCEIKGMILSTWEIKWRILEATFDSFKKHPDDSMLVVKEFSTKFRRS